MTDALKRLKGEGFRDDFRVEDGSLVAREAGRRFRPEELDIAHEMRFEGTSNPADESILLALESEDGSVKGTFSAAFGPNTPEQEAAILRSFAQRRSDSPRS